MRSLGAPLATSLLSLIAIAMAAGCFSPNAPEGNPCAPGGLCPDGLSCIGQVCISSIPDGPIDGPPGDGSNASPDLDLDGVLNAADNCPTAANPLQHDEDGDKVGDVCDNCPHVTNAPQANADGDGVGDLCDPRPFTAGDKISMFLAFDQATLPPGVTTVGGNWSKAATGDMYQQTNTNTNPNTPATLLVDGARDGFVVEIGGKTTSIDNNFVWLTTTFGEATGTSRYYSCGFLDLKDVNPDDLNQGTIEEYDGNGYSYVAGTPAQTQLANNAAFKISAQVDSTAKSVACATTDPRGPPTTNSTTGAARLVPGRVGIRSNGVAYTLDYLVVLGR
jgi:Thrombospondin type 3 repeat